MKLFRSRLCLIAVLTVAACGDGNSTDVNTALAFERQSDSFLADYQAAQAGSAVSRPLDVSGDWFGLMFCPSGLFPMTIEVSQSDNALDATVSIEAAIGDGRRQTPFHAPHTGRPGSGKAAPATRSFRLEVARDPEADGRQARGLDVNLLLAPGNAERALLAVTETSGARRQRACLDGIAARGDAATRLRALSERIASIKTDRRPVVQGDCPQRYRDWLAGMPEKGTLSFDDDAFVAALGKPYLQLDAEELLQASAVISGSCADSKDRKQRVSVLRLGGYLRDHRSYQTALQTQWRDQIWAGWRDWVDAELARGVNYDMTAAVALRTMPHRFGLRQHPTAAAFDRSIAPLADQGQSSRRNLDFAGRLEANKDDFRGLLELHQQANSRGDIDMDMVRTALSYYLAAAAERFSAQADSVADATFMWAWTAQQSAAAQCPAATAESCARAAAHFNDRLDDLAETLADATQAAFTSLAERDDDLDKLAALVDFERQLGASHGALLDHPAFADANERRSELRHELQDDLADELVQLANSSDTAPGLRAIESRYYIDADLQTAAGEDMRQAIAGRLAASRPFSELRNGEYFNALYNRDFSTLRALDRRYLQGIRPLLSLGTQQAITLAPLVDTIAGRKRGSTAAELQRGLHNLTALYAVLGTYLLEYQDAYADCLKPNAVTIEISERIDRVRKDGFGNVIERHEGWTERDYYKVNPEFRNQFQSLFDAAKGPELGQLLDLFANDAQVTRLRSATRDLMQTHACDAPQVRQLEAGLLAYDRELKRRVRG